jgi:hypothetical protein
MTFTAAGMRIPTSSFENSSDRGSCGGGEIDGPDICIEDNSGNSDDTCRRIDLTDFVVSRTGFDDVEASVSSKLTESRDRLEGVLADSLC